MRMLKEEMPRSCAKEYTAGDGVDEFGLSDHMAAGVVDLAGSSVDLTDGFYQFRATRFAAYLGLDFRCSALGVVNITGTLLTSAWDDDLGAGRALDPHDVVEACFQGMAMGWSWALFFCHEAVSHCMSQGLQDCRKSQSMPFGCVLPRRPTSTM